MSNKRDVKLRVKFNDGSVLEHLYPSNNIDRPQIFVYYIRDHKIEVSIAIARADEWDPT